MVFYEFNNSEINDKSPMGPMLKRQYYSAKKKKRKDVYPYSTITSELLE